MILQVGVKVFLRNNEGKYLLLKRAPSKFKGINGTWDIVGGRIETGTTLEKNLQREVREETGLEMISDPKLLYAQDILWKENDTHVVRLTYLADTEGEPVLDIKENVEHKWLSIDEMKSLDGLDSYVKVLLDKKIIYP